jgi:hypothetical protein
MRIQEYMQSLTNLAQTDEEKGVFVAQAIPLGLGELDQTIVAHQEVCPARYHHICVTGEKRGEYIRRLVLSLGKLYGQDKVSFLILSPDKKYGELLHVKDSDITVPFVNRYEDCQSSLDTLRELVRMRAAGEENYPKLFVVLDGLEDVIENKGEKQSFACFKPFFDVVGASGVELVTGVDLEKSIFSGYPGAFVGVGNCLVSLREEGKADVTYVNDDASMSLPIPVHYPSEPSVMETIIYLNALPEL